MGDQLLFGKEDAFPTVQHLSEAADAAEELSRCQPRQRSPILCQASQVNEVVCFGVGREFDVVTEHVIQKCLFPYPAVMRNHCHGSFCRMVQGGDCCLGCSQGMPGVHHGARVRLHTRSTANLLIAAQHLHHDLLSQALQPRKNQG